MWKAQARTTRLLHFCYFEISLLLQFIFSVLLIDHSRLQPLSPITTHHSRTISVAFNLVICPCYQFASSRTANEYQRGQEANESQCSNGNTFEFSYKG